MNSVTSPMGKPLDRVDGPLKVQGKAQYAAEFPLPGLLYGSVVNSTIACGRIAHIHIRAAQEIPGVALILTHENRPSVAGYDEPYEDDDAADGSPFRPLFNDRILYSGQPIALVVADSLELARHAASLVRVEYEQDEHATDLMANLEHKHQAPADLPKPRGDAELAIDAAAFKVDVKYTTPVEHHNPMEPHASTVEYLPDGNLTIYDKTQGVQNCMRYLEDVFDMKGQIQILSPYVGGAFGSGLRPQYQLPLAVMAALKLKRSVRITLTRQQMFTFGYRPRSIQRLAIGAANDGQLQGILHQAIAQTSRFEDFTEQEVEWSGMLYKCPAVKLDYQLVPLDVYTPLDMRAPGATIGVYALECAMDEL
ncbi:MAG: xanthine dehydrogenase family protein molybdopterin-binding subunit, partial [Pseudomonas sp.]